MYYIEGICILVRQVRNFFIFLADGFRLRSPVVVHSYYNENNSHGKVKLNGLIYGYLFKGSTKLVTTAPLVVGLTNVVFP